MAKLTTKHAISTGFNDSSTVLGDIVDYAVKPSVQDALEAINSRLRWLEGVDYQAYKITPFTNMAVNPSFEIYSSTANAINWQRDAPHNGSTLDYSVDQTKVDTKIDFGSSRAAKSTSGAAAATNYAAVHQVFAAAALTPYRFAFRAKVDNILHQPFLILKDSNGAYYNWVGAVWQVVALAQDHFKYFTHADLNYQTDFQVVTTDAAVTSVDMYMGTGSFDGTHDTEVAYIDNVMVGGAGNTVYHDEFTHVFSSSAAYIKRDGKLGIREIERLYAVATPRDVFVNGGTGLGTADGNLAEHSFATITQALEHHAGTLKGGQLRINLAAGTYTESIVVPDFVGAQLSTTFGNSFVTLLGDPAVPNNVILAWDGVSAAVITNSSKSTALSVNGIKFSINAPIVLKANPGSKTFLSNIEMDRVVQAINAIGAYVEVSRSGLPSLAWSCTNNMITATDQSYIVVDDFIDGSALQGTGILLDNSFLNNSGTQINLAGDGVAGMSYGLKMQNRAGFFSSERLIVSNAFNNVGGTVVPYGLHVDENCAIITASTTAWDFDTCTNLGKIDKGSMFFDRDYEIGGGACIFSPIGVTPTILHVGSRVALYNTGQFGGLTLNYLPNTFGGRFADDNRYVTSVYAQHSGAIPIGATNYFGLSQLQSDEIVLYRCRDLNEKVVQFDMQSLVANGAAQTDTYTIRKNGIDTLMVLAITNAASGSTIANPVSMVAGDYLSVKLVSAAATVGANPFIQLTIMKQ